MADDECDRGGQDGGDDGEDAVAKTDPATQPLRPLEVRDDLVDGRKLRPRLARRGELRGVVGAHAHGERVRQRIALEARAQLGEGRGRLELGKRPFPPYET